MLTPTATVPAPAVGIPGGKTRRQTASTASFPGKSPFTDESACLTAEVAVITDESACLTDEVPVITDESACLTDEVAGITDEFACLTDEVAVITDEFACMTDEPVRKFVWRVKPEDRKT